MASSCFYALGTAFGDQLFRVFRKETLVWITLILAFGLVVLSGVLADKAGSRAKDLEMNTYVTCEGFFTITKPFPQNATAPEQRSCFFEKKHPNELILGPSPEEDKAAVAVCVIGWIMVVVFSMALTCGMD